ncbi:hypothetical protein [Streptomyces sp. Root369]|uniref:hypothetical protein n=1 Tax=Streptomyces sp. Root369 TaxID=1736523 RepID=UPI00070E0CC3|nr:hypothetical protein [Streptomyces sp. Root369]KQW13572.1 hypothetical protein ASD08_30885 [Streptomyces sp. Root369]
MTVEQLAQMETVAKRFRVSPDKLAELGVDQSAEEITITWQQVTDRPSSVLVTAPAGEEGWAVPIPHRPGWLMDVILKQAPGWWLK